MSNNACQKENSIIKDQDEKLNFLIQVNDAQKKDVDEYKIKMKKTQKLVMFQTVLLLFTLIIFVVYIFNSQN